MPWKFSYSRNLNLIIIVTIGAVLTLSAFFMVRMWEEVHVKAKFIEEALDYSSLFQQKMVHYTDEVEALKHFFDSVEEVDRASFRKFASSIMREDADVKALEWIPYVRAEKKEEFENRAKADNLEHFLFREKGSNGEMIPVSERSAYYPVFYVEPFKGNEKAVGFDLGSNPMRFAAIRKARDSGTAVATGRLHLVQEDGDQIGFLLFIPVYDSGKKSDTVDRRKESIKGFVLGVFSIGKIFKSTILETSNRGINIELFDRSEHSRESFLYSNRKSGKGRISENQIIRHTTEIEVGGRRWEMVFTPIHGYFSINRGLFSWLALLTGILITSLLMGYIVKSGRATEHIRKMVIEKTAELQETLRMLKKSEQRWQFALEGSGGGVWDWNVITNEVYFSLQWKRMLGFEDSEIKHDLSEWDVRIHPDDKEKAYESVNRHLSGENDFYMDEHRLMCKDGSYKWILDRGKVIEWTDDGKPLRFVGTHEDITLRKERENALRKFKKGVEEAGHAIYFTDISGTIEYVNPAFLKLTGYLESEVVGKNPKIMKSGKMNREYYENLWKTILAGKMWSEEVINRRKSGEIYFARQTIAPMVDSKGGIDKFIAIQMDITGQKRAEAALAVAKEDAESANRAKSFFLANMSHEIRTPMNAVIGFSNLLHAMIRDETQKSYVESILTSGKSLLCLINDILDFSKVEAGKLKILNEPVSIQAIVEDMQKIFKMGMSAKNVEFIIDIDEGLPAFLMLDETRMRQIMLNLIGNAVKFTESGYIEISVKKLESTNEKETLDLLISVKDTGMGIPEDQKDLIFQAFSQQDGQRC